MKNAYGNFFIHSQSKRLFHTWEKRFIQSAVKMDQSVRKSVHVFVGASSIFIYRSLKSFHKITPVFLKIGLNHRQSSNRFIALDKSIKQYIQEEQTKKKTKTPTRCEVSLLSEFLNRRKRQENFQRRQMCHKHFRRQILPSKEMSGSSKQTTSKSKATETNQTQLKQGKHYEKYLH